jgi:DNA-directed RNA polymerase subunit RPC12/RpoP/ribosomal protein L40E
VHTYVLLRERLIILNEKHKHMFCTQCGFQLPDDAKFCAKCGAPQKVIPSQPVATQPPTVQSSSGIIQLKCPGCGAPITPKLGETVISCDYCGGSVFLGSKGWENVQKHTMLPINIFDREQVLAKAREVMNKGLLHHHRFEKSKLLQSELSIIPYWLFPASATTSVTYLWGQTGGSEVYIGGGNRGPIFEPTSPGTPEYKTEVVDNIYDFPVVAVKSMRDCQPGEFQFSLDQRVIFESSKIPKGIKVLNGDVSENDARIQARALVDKLQYQKAHERHKFHTISKIETRVDIGEGELLHAPIWRLKFDNEGKQITLVIDANSGNVISSSGL